MVIIFIVNQNGDRCENIEKIIYELDYDDETLNELHKIYNRIHAKVYNWGSEENCINEIRREQSDYLTYNNCKKILRIYVNGTLFAIYKDISKGVKIFCEILECIKEDCNIFNLNENKYLEEEISKN